MADTRWIEQRHRGYYAVRDVPRPLRSLLGKKRFVKSLETRDLHVAIARRHAALAEFQREIDAALARVTTGGLVEEGLMWRETLAAIERGDKVAVSSFRGPAADHDEWGNEITLSPKQAARETATMILHDRIDDLRYAQDRTEDASLLASVAQGLTTPLLTFVDPWLREGGPRGPYTGRTPGQYRADLQDLVDWLEREGIPVLIESVTKATAGRYVSAMVADGRDRKTINRKLSAASSYWRWMLKRTSVEMNPWTGQSLSKVNKPGQEKSKRPYTAAEMKALLEGKTDRELADAIRVGALSGMRIEEIYRLTVADCAGGWFNVRVSKTAAGVRRVPVHSDLAAIVARRAAGKAASAFLFDEAGPVPKPGRERSMPASKRFGHYRKRVGVTDLPEGARQDRVDFHSLRRWFVTMARNARMDRATVAAVVGHEAGNITDDVYSGGPDEALLRACVEAVRLPSAEPSE